MLINFSFDNWKSFSDFVNFSMLATRELQHKESLAKLDAYKKGVLPIAAIYGGNASGKSNFCDALRFVKNFVVDGTKPNRGISVKPFKLNKGQFKQPSHFSIQVLVDEAIYELSFSATDSQVIEEKLTRIKRNGEEIVCYQYDSDRKLVIGSAFNLSNGKKTELESIFNRTRENQLFLTSSVLQNFDDFKSIYDWFDNTLTFISPSSFEENVHESSLVSDDMNMVLCHLDTGISRLDFEDISLKHAPRFFMEFMQDRLKEKLKEGQSASFEGGIFGNKLVIATKTEGELTTKKLVSVHKSADGSEVKFDIQDESDGTQQIIDLLPTFFVLSNKNISAGKNNKVYVIDELNLRLHTLLTKSLLEFYLNSCSKTNRSQLLFTTHDVLLMDQSIFRRDEIWVTERNANGGSKLFSFSDYKDVRYDKDIRKSYLQGRLGGIPRIFL